jgi:hypothetical protein
MMPQLNEEKKLLYQLKALHVINFLPKEGKQFILYLPLFLLLKIEEEELMMGEEIKILDCLIVEKLYLEHQLLEVKVNFRTLQ